MRTVIDTNVFVSSFLNPAGTPRRIIDLWKRGDVILCVSEKTIEEYAVVLVRLGLEGEPEMEELLDLFKKRANILFTAPPGDLKVVEADPADDRFIECALHAKADFVISGGKHLLSAQSYEGIRVITPPEFLRTVTSQSPPDRSAGWR